MNSRRPEIGDEENTSFELLDTVLEDLKPGLAYGEETLLAKAQELIMKGVHHRFPRCDRMDIPQRSLAERLRDAPKGG